MTLKYWFYKINGYSYNDDEQNDFPQVRPIKKAPLTTQTLENDKVVWYFIVNTTPKSRCIFQPSSANIGSTTKVCIASWHRENPSV